MLTIVLSQCRLKAVIYKSCKMFSLFILLNCSCGTSFLLCLLVYQYWEWVCNKNLDQCDLHCYLTLTIAFPLNRLTQPSTFLLICQHKYIWPYSEFDRFNLIVSLNPDHLLFRFATCESLCWHKERGGSALWVSNWMMELLLLAADWLKCLLICHFF